MVFDPTAAKVEDLVKAVEKAGYKGTPESEQNGVSQGQRQQEEIKHQWRKFLFSFFLFLLFLVIV